MVSFERKKSLEEHVNEFCNILIMFKSLDVNRPLEDSLKLEDEVADS